MSENDFPNVADDGAAPGQEAQDPSHGGMVEIVDDKRSELGRGLAKRRDQWINARRSSGVERRWMEDLDQYNGKDDASKRIAAMMETVAAGGYAEADPATKAQRSTVFVNITRPKTTSAEARLANMLIPTDDRNWGIKPTPDPKLTAAALAEAKQSAMAATAAASAPAPAAAAPAAAPAMSPAPPGAPAPAGAMPAAPMPTPMAGAMQAAGVTTAPIDAPVSAQARIEEAVKRAEAMQSHIDDQLVGCDYNGQLRQVIHDTAVLGTGIIKGPIVVNRSRRAWIAKKTAEGKTVHVMEYVEEKDPASERVSPWNLITDPACGDNIHNGRGAFEKKDITSKQVRELVKQPGYDAASIQKVLMEGPKSAVSPTQRDQQKALDHGAGSAGELFEMWEYWGQFEPDELRAAGVEVPEGSTEMISGCIILINNHVVKGFLNPIETGDLPYDMMVWERMDDSVWGVGIPRILNSAQRVLNAGWRQLMDNAALAVGPQIVVNPALVQPHDGKWELTGRKFWFLNDAQCKASDVFSTFEVPSHIEDIQRIIEMSLKFVDDESSIPTIMQGEKGNSPETLGGMQLLMNSSNVVLSRLVKQFDDSITRPHIRRYYDWNMAYSENDDIKGDFTVDARGSSALLVRDVQSQALLQIGAYAGNPTIGAMVNWKGWLKEVLKSQHIDATNIMKTDAEIAAMADQPPPQSPDQLRADSAMQVAQIRAAAATAVANAKKDGELAYAQTEAQMMHDNHIARVQELQVKRDLAVLDYANKHALTLEQVKADLAKTAMQEQTKRQVAAVEAQLSQNQHHGQLAVDLHKHHNAGADALTAAAPAPVPEAMSQ